MNPREQTSAWAGHQTTRGVAIQAGLLILLAVCVRRADAQEDAAAEQLRRECDALIDMAVKRPYGWAWTAEPERDPKDRKPQVSLHPADTPAAGLVLLWAGILLEEPRYTNAAVQAARGIAASQLGNGKIPAAPTFGPGPGGRDVSAAVPERASTRAGLVLLLATIGAEPSRDEMLRRSALRAATWLARQQSDDGGWPASAPIGAGAAVPQRLIRLDNSDVRDSTAALLLAANVLDDKLAAHAANRAVNKLLTMRLAGPGKLGSLWSTFYTLDGSLEERIEGLPAGADVLASRRVVEVLLAAALLAENDDARLAARDAAKALAALHNNDGLWQRMYPLHGDLRPTSQSVFESATRPLADPAILGDFGVSEVLGALDQLRQVGPGQFAATLSQTATLQERLASAICELSDEPFAALVAPRRDSPPSSQLRHRVQHAHELLMKLRKEQRTVWPDR